MSAAVSAADANREFSKLLRRVRDGETVTITSHGRPVAKLVPAGADDRVRVAAWQALMKRLKTQRRRRRVPLDWTREDLYD